VLFEYLWYSTPQYLYWIVPLATLVSCLVTLGAITKSSELTIMRACGVSLYRTVTPLLLLALVWSGGLFLLEEQVMPQANKRAQVLNDLIRERTPVGSLDDRHWLVGHDDRIYYYWTLDTHQGLMSDLSLFEFAADGFRLDRHLYAQRVMARRGSEWLARVGWTQTFPKTGATSRRQSFQNLSLTLEPMRAFTADQVDPDVMSYADLRKEVARRAAGGFTVAESAVQLEGKLAFPLATLVMTLIGIPFAVTHGRRGALYGIGVGIALALTYRLAVVFFAAAGSAGLLSPMLAAWAPNLLFVAGATTFLLTVRT
jgi:LPS export ABC transporter permease LptG